MLQVEASPFRKACRIQAAGTKRIKSVARWGDRVRGGVQFLNKERDLIPHSFASGKASVTILSQPEMCTVTPSNPHNML